MKNIIFVDDLVKDVVGVEVLVDRYNEYKVSCYFKIVGSFVNLDIF